MLFWSLPWLFQVLGGLVSFSHKGDISARKPHPEFFLLIPWLKGNIQVSSYFPVSVYNKKSGRYSWVLSPFWTSISSLCPSVWLSCQPLFCLLSRPLVARSWQSQWPHLIWPLGFSTTFSSVSLASPPPHLLISLLLSGHYILTALRILPWSSSVLFAWMISVNPWL